MKRSVVTVGTFDGVHRGHQMVLRTLKERAHELGLASVVVTFDQHPLNVVRPEQAPKVLTTREEKEEILGRFGRNGRYAGQFHWVHNLAVDSKGNIYTAEVDTGKRAQKFVPKGRGTRGHR